tara:strand:+ start:350 stop:739 length:390 start_codon:yes stop_codon:yes gene_type:complete
MNLEIMVNFKSYRLWMLLSYIIIMISNSLFSFINTAGIWRYDKIIHFAEYFILGVLLFHVMYEKPFTRKEVLYYVGFISLIPIIDESMQFYSELWGQKRIPSIYDAFADYAGCYTGCICYSIKYRIFNG